MNTLIGVMVQTALLCAVAAILWIKSGTNLHRAGAICLLAAVGALFRALTDQGLVDRSIAGAEQVVGLFTILALTLLVASALASRLMGRGIGVAVGTAALLGCALAVAQGWVEMAINCVGHGLCL